VETAIRENETFEFGIFASNEVNEFHPLSEKVIHRDRIKSVILTLLYRLTISFFSSLLLPSTSKKISKLLKHVLTDDDRNTRIYTYKATYQQKKTKKL
jgi:hypothetical protein